MHDFRELIGRIATSRQARRTDGEPRARGRASVDDEGDLAQTSGYYFADCNPLLPDPRMEDEAMAAKLWDVSEELAAGYLI